MVWFHLGDTMRLVDPDGSPERLQAAGFEHPLIEPGDGRFKFSARRPGPLYSDRRPDQARLAVDGQRGFRMWARTTSNTAPMTVNQR
jgi:hypothetical protein